MDSSSVLILGTGAAGLRAALELRRAGIQVRVAAKGGAGVSGATPSAIFSYCCPDPGDPADCAGLFRQDILRSGLTVNDPELAEFMARDGYARLEDLTRMGMPWTRNARGDPDRVRLPGHSADRAFHVDWRTGKALSSTLLKSCLAAGVQFAQYQLALDLWVEREGRVRVALLDLRSAQAAAWECDALILATGGAPSMYRLHTNPPGQTGDGMAMVLRAGGLLVDMEFMQMYPTVLVATPAAFGMEFAAGRLLAGGARLFNRKGEDFFGRWEEGPAGNATRDKLARAIAREIASGGGTVNGGVFLDARQVPELGEQSRYVRFLKELGVDLAAAAQEVAPGAHYSLGGVKLVPPASCALLPGVFAAGEVTGGVHGANRLAGNALTETQVFGALAGMEAARFVREAGGRGGQGKSEPWPLSPGESSLWDLLCRARGRPEGERIDDLRAALRETVQRCGSTVRTAEGLREGLDRLRVLTGAYRDRLSLAAFAGRWHPEMGKAVEMANMLEVARALLASALSRTESRGAHFREDYPGADRNLEGRNFLVKGTGEGMEVERVDRAGGERKRVWP